MDKASRSGGLKDVKLSFVGHFIGNVIIRIALSAKDIGEFQEHNPTIVSKGDYSRKGKVFHDMLNNCLDQIRFPSSEQQMFMICDIRLGVSALEFDRQGIYLASVTRSGCLTVHDYESLYCRSNQHVPRLEEDEGKQLLHISLSNSVDVVCWNPTNQDKVACTSLSHNEVHIFDIGYISSEPTEILRKRPTVTVHGSNVHKGLTDIALFNDDTRVLASDTCGAINIWDRRAGNFPQTWLTTNANSSLTSIQLNGDQTSQFLLPYSVLASDNTMALEELYGNEEMTRKGDECLNVMANRIATVFASLLEFPFVRYRAAKSLGPTTMTTIRDLIPTKLAAAVWNCLMKYKSLKNFYFPQTETCELLILDRSIDQIAPIIHEWTYDAMCHDLLNMEGNKYVHEVASKTGGLSEKKEVLLEDHDPVWLELRHSHIADASERLHDKMTSFVSKNKAAQMHGSSEQIDKLSLHVDVSSLMVVAIATTDLEGFKNDAKGVCSTTTFYSFGTKKLLMMSNRQRREEEIKTKSSKKAVDAEQSLLNRASSPQTSGNLKSMKDTKQDKDEKEGPTLKTAGPDGEITAVVS
ncbi:hypothetical protein L2E82_05740 [Cichorium intybus]|uniref:Uncharacterized protein n=1 Tax=Cichorium intybus TaxID=13427 RepID=A0ACB9H9E7_CICIN|nr:hypothetical protein L2E82_05740 [Cichorium intybus]